MREEAYDKTSSTRGLVERLHSSSMWSRRHEFETLQLQRCRARESRVFPFFSLMKETIDGGNQPFFFILV